MATKSTFVHGWLTRLPLTVLLVGALSGCLRPPMPSKPPVEAGKSISFVSEHLTLGNPSEAAQTDPNNYLLTKPQFALCFNKSRGIANWVSWHLSLDWRGNAARTKSFRPDPDLPAGFSTIKTADYERTGFDRGHLCPSDDRDKSPTDNAATFVLSNVVPQAPLHNRETWKYLEEYARKLVDQGNEVYITAGATGVGGTGEQGDATSIAGGRVTVPAALWKVLLVLPNGTDDINRIGPNTQVIAVYIPNTQAAASQPWQSYKLTVNDLEQKTGYRFFTNLSPDLQRALKNQGIGSN
ncbi:DNA/RNA non-specific endonuclease [Fibrella sp. HMF5335]|uniref:DNA/RNA non-specific endonuclease n=1 Tax=Fibrella rubiginis TaxID=2817060 RepID=A0A939K724_9BACT|nr:DNA/RNA non-specific endonuclease [Fibrella rubiginis]MBO0939488.1 DNA/RNA non-specific endonuclease [Fibrella rubiginis]